MPTGTKIAAIVLVVLLGAAGLYFAFQSPSNTSKTTGKGSGLTAPEGGLGSASNAAGGTTGTPVTMPPAGAGSGSDRLDELARANGGPGAAPGTTPGVVPGFNTGTNTAPSGALAGNNASGSTGAGSNPGFSNGSARVNNTGATTGATTGGVNGLAGNNGGVGNVGTGTSTPAGSNPGTKSAGSTPAGSTLAGSSVGSNSTPTAPTTTTSSPTSGNESTHVVAKGETMESIAKSIYGSSNKWQAIAKANPNVDPSRMKIGTKLRIPAAGATLAGEGTVAAGSTKSTKTAATSGDTGKTTVASAPTNGGSGKGASHTVAKGETMSSIARKYFGDSKFWKAIAKANPKVDANNLAVGTKLSIPAKTAVVGGENVER